MKQRCWRLPNMVQIPTVLLETRFLLWFVRWVTHGLRRVIRGSCNRRLIEKMSSQWFPLLSKVAHRVGPKSNPPLIALLCLSGHYSTYAYPELGHLGFHHTQYLLTSVALATRQDEDGDTYELFLLSCQSLLRGKAIPFILSISSTRQLNVLNKSKDTIPEGI